VEIKVLPDFGPVRRPVEMLKQLQMGMRAFFLMASRVWTCICFLLKKQVRAVSRGATAPPFASPFASPSEGSHESRTPADAADAAARLRRGGLLIHFLDYEFYRDTLMFSNIDV
jgi:hypothetical protein